MSAELGQLLRRLVDEDAHAFDCLFESTGARKRVALDGEIAAPLRQAGLVEGEDDQLWGLSRARRLGRRFYFLELGEGQQYHQDVWPETDALLEVLSRSTPGRCLDIGTGCGILAIEAAARGHSVVATDLYPNTVELARWNARLNDIEGIDFRVGHLFDPVAGERFDLILTAPHYGRTFDQLRLEVLRGALDHLLPEGRLHLATALEWEQGGPLAIEPLLSHGRARVRPIVSKRTWFSNLVGDVPRLVSRHRFIVEIGHGSGLDVELPPADSQPTQSVVPLSRLRRGTAALVDGEDVFTLRRLLEGLAQPVATLEVLPEPLLDACRLGARACSTAAGAILDLDGGVRPCTHGQPVARFDDSLAQLTQKLTALADEAAARRGCSECPARAVCSRCLFSGPIDDYCDFIRAHAVALPRFHRLRSHLAQLDQVLLPATLERWPRPSGAAPAWPQLTQRWNDAEVWLLTDGERASLWRRGGGGPIDAQLAWLGRLVGDGADASAVETSRTGAGVSPRRLHSLLERLAHLLGADPPAGMARTSD